MTVISIHCTRLMVCSSLKNNLLQLHDKSTKVYIRAIMNIWSLVPALARA